MRTFLKTALLASACTMPSSSYAMDQYFNEEPTFKRKENHLSENERAKRTKLEGYEIYTEVEGGTAKPICTKEEYKGITRAIQKIENNHIHSDDHWTVSELNTPSAHRILLLVGKTENKYRIWATDFMEDTSVFKKTGIFEGVLKKAVPVIKKTPGYIKRTDNIRNKNFLKNIIEKSDQWLGKTQQISKAQAFKIIRETKEEEHNPPKYNRFTYNCMHWVTGKIDNAWRISGWKTNHAPSMAVDKNGKIYIAHTWIDNSLSVASSDDEGVTFPNHYKIEGWKTKHSPSLALDKNGKLYIAHTWMDGSFSVASSDNGGVTFPHHNKIEGWKTRHSPSIAVDGNGKLYIAHTWMDGSVSVASSNDLGKTLLTHYKIDNWKTNYSPSLSVDENGKIYVAHTWTGICGNAPINVAYSENGGETFQKQPAINGWLTNASPSIAAHKNGKLYIAHKWILPGNISVASSDNQGITFPYRHQIEGWESFHSPSLTVGQNGKVYIQHVEKNGSISVPKQIDILN